MVADHDRISQELRAHRLWQRIAERMKKKTLDPREVADRLQAIKDGKKFRKASEMAAPVTDASGDFADWRSFLKKFFGIDLDVSKLRIPEHPEEFKWSILMTKGLTLKKIVEEMKKHMDVYLNIDLDKVTSDRNPDNDCVVFVRDRVEADEELAGKSADDLNNEGVNGITLPERLLLGFFYWWKTGGQHLDVEYWTMCSGSRYVDADGDVGVAGVCWSPGYREVCVDWDYLGNRDDGGFRSRQAVS